MKFNKKMLSTSGLLNYRRTRMRRRHRNFDMFSFSEMNNNVPVVNSSRSAISSGNSIISFGKRVKKKRERAKRGR